MVLCSNRHLNCSSSTRFHDKASVSATTPSETRMFHCAIGSRVWGYDRSDSAIFIPISCRIPLPTIILSRLRASGQHAHRRSRLRLDLSTAHREEGAVAGNTVYRHEQQRRSRLKEIGRRRELGRVEDDRAVALDSESVVELHDPLTHAHRVRREPWAYHPYRRISRRVIRIARV
jgi:hypothetical protein